MSTPASAWRPRRARGADRVPAPGGEDATRDGGEATRDGGAGAGGDEVGRDGDGSPDSDAAGDDHTGGDHDAVGATAVDADPVAGRASFAAAPGAALAIARRTLSRAWKDRILGLSAEAAFWQVLSLPPLLLAVLATIGYLGSTVRPSTLDTLRDQLVDLAGEVVSPALVDDVVRPTIEDLLRNGRGGVATISVLIALWAGSSATATFVNTITIAYGQRDVRGTIASRLVSLALYLCFLAVGAVAAPLLLLGPDTLVAALPADWRGGGGSVVRTLYWPVTAALIFGGLAVFYHYAVPVRLRWRRALPGAALAVVLFLVFSWVLRLYVGAVFSRLLLFSTLAAPVLTLLYFYAIALAVLFGAELNATLEERWPREPGRARLPGLWAALGGRRPASPPTGPTRRADPPRTAGRRSTDPDPAAGRPADPGPDPTGSAGRDRPGEVSPPVESTRPVEPAHSPPGGSDS